MQPELFMKRAIDLALLGKGRTAPNPIVGCVIEHNGIIIGEGWHKKAGEGHAEVNAFKSVTDIALLSESNVYVTLEPCSHFGKTPPCSDLIVSKNVNKVFVGSVDTNPIVARNGILKIQNSGIETVDGILEKECKNLNRSFNTSKTIGRPWVTLKWAQSSDFFIDPRISKEKTGQHVISNLETKVLTHKLRNQHDAILVGTNTALTDNPSLNNRLWPGKSPIKIIIDRKLRVPKSAQLFKSREKIIVITEEKQENLNNIIYLKLNFKNFMAELMHSLSNLDIQSLFVEGGQKTLQYFIDAELWDEAIVYTSQNKFLQGVKAPVILAPLQQEMKIGDNRVSVFRP